MAQTASGQIFITADDRGPLANIGAWITMVFMILFVASKITTKALCIGRLQKDDLFVTLSLIAAVIHVIFVSIQVQDGIGRHLSSLNTVVQLQKFIYLSTIFFIIAVGLSQIAILTYMVMLSRDQTHRSVVRSILVAASLLAFTSFLVTIFPCEGSTPWAIFGERCIDQGAFWTAWTTVNIALDLAIGLLPVFLLWSLQVARSSKFAVLGAFAVRVFTVPVGIIRLIYLKRAIDSTDPTFSYLDAVLLTSLQMNITIILTCVPFLKPVLDGLQSGILGGDLWATSNTHARAALTSTVRKSKEPRGLRPSPDWPISGNNGYQTFIGFATPPPHQGGRDSQESRQPMVINQTTEILVESPLRLQQDDQNFLE